MSREYSECGRLEGGHSAAITAIAISPRASYLASAALDNRVCVWELSSGKLLYEFNGSSAAVSLAWLPSGEDRILCGMLDGYVVSLSLFVRAITARGLIVHSTAVECLVIKGQRVASGAHREVRIWDWTADGSWTLHREVEEPPSNPQEEVLVTGLSWDDSAGRTRLVVAYLEHGIRIFDTHSWTCVCEIADGNLMVKASVRGEHLVACDPTTGFNLYSLKSGHLVHAFGHGSQGSRAASAKLIEAEPGAIVRGTMGGEVTIWDAVTGRKVQTLRHQDHRMMLIVDACHDYIQRRFLIATAPSGEPPYSIILWNKKELNTPPYARLGSGLAPGEPEEVSTRRLTPSKVACFIVVTTVFAVCMAVSIYGLADDSGPVLPTTTRLFQRF